MCKVKLVYHVGDVSYKKIMSLPKYPNVGSRIRVPIEPGREVVVQVAEELPLSENRDYVTYRVIYTMKYRKEATEFLLKVFSKV